MTNLIVGTSVAIRASLRWISIASITIIGLQRGTLLLRKIVTRSGLSLYAGCMERHGHARKS